MTAQAVRQKVAAFLDWRYAPVILLVLWLGVIFFFSAQTTIGAKPGITFEVVLRKIAHFFEFFILTFLVYKTAATYRPKAFTRNMWIAVICSILYAMSDELHQGVVPGRRAAVIDVMIDSFGVLMMALFMILERERQRGRSAVTRFFTV